MRAFCLQRGDDDGLANALGSLAWSPGLLDVADRVRAKSFRPAVDESQALGGRVAGVDLDEALDAASSKDASDLAPAEALVRRYVELPLGGASHAARDRVLPPDPRPRDPRTAVLRSDPAAERVAW